MVLTGTQESEAYYDGNGHLHPRHKRQQNSFRVHKFLEQMCTICMRDIKIAIEKYCEEIGSLSSCFSNGFK